MTPTTAMLAAAKIKDPSKWIDAVIQTCQEFEINTEQRIAGFLAQTSHESAGYTMLKENLNYRAATLAACWPHRFAVQEPDPNKPGKTRAKKDAKGANIPTKLAESIAGKPDQIALLTYSNRMGNGPAETGEAAKFIGRGLKQLPERTTIRGVGWLWALILWATLIFFLSLFMPPEVRDGFGSRIIFHLSQTKATLKA